MPSMISVAFIVIGAVVVTLVFIVLARRPARGDEGAPDNAPFECGATPSAAYPRRVAVQYFLTAILFVVMLIALVLIIIWVRDFTHIMEGSAKLSALIGAGIFFVLIAMGFGYAWRVGAFNWEK